MDFNKLMQTMRDLDRPVGEAAVQECGMDSPMMGGMTPPMAPTPPHNPPTLSVNLNAQGMDDIESIMRLMTKVNPDMINQPMPKAAEIEPMGMPSLTPPGPSITPLSLGNLDSGPLKMLPDFDKDNDDMPGGEMDKDDSPVADIQKAMGDQDGDGDHDMDDHDMEKKMVDKDPIDKDGKEDGEADNDKEKEGLGGALAGGAIGAAAGGPLGALTGAAAGDSLTDPDGDEEEKEEAWANEPDTEVKSVDYMNNQLAGGMNKPKQMSKHSYKQGDNPMAMESGDLRAYIRAELQQRLAEAKGAK
jgi:hypothetical protein